MHSKWKCCKIKLHPWYATSYPVENGFQLLNLYSSIDLFKCMMSCHARKSWIEKETRARWKDYDSRVENFLKLATCHAQFIIWIHKDLTRTSNLRGLSKFMQKFVQENSLSWIFFFFSCLVLRPWFVLWLWRRDKFKINKMNSVSFRNYKSSVNIRSICWKSQTYKISENRIHLLTSISSFLW